MKTGIHIKPVIKTGSVEKHNERNPDYLASVKKSGKMRYQIFEDETSKNSSSINPEYAGLKLTQVKTELAELVKEKTGRRMQAKASPIREGVCPIMATTKPEDFKPVILWFRKKHISVIRIDLHHDEGHVDAETGKRKYNHHAHIVLDWVNHETGRSAKLNKKDMSELQTVLAKALGMERGKSLDEIREEEKAKGNEVGKGYDPTPHLSPQQYREKEAAKTAQRLQQKIDNLEEQIAQLEPTAEEARQEFMLLELLQKEIEHLENEKQRIENEKLNLFGRLKSGREREIMEERDRALREKEEAAETAKIAVKEANATKEEAERLANTHRKALQAIEADKAAAKKEGYKEGADYQHNRWKTWYDNNHAKVKTERDQLAKDKADLLKGLEEAQELIKIAYDEHLQQAVNTAKTLISTYGAEPFEKDGLDFTTFGSWKKAKEELGLIKKAVHQKYQGPKLN